MDCLLKVSIDEKVRRSQIIKISLVGSVSLLGLILGIYSLVIHSFLFAVWYFLAFILGLSYVSIRINACIPTFLATDGEKITLSVWENGILPYSVPEKPNFVSDFIPEKVKATEIAMEDVNTVIFGSRKYLKKVLSDEEYPEILKRLDENKHYDNVLRRMDFLFIRTKDGENFFMSITDFDLRLINDFIAIVEKNCIGVQILINIPRLVKLRKFAVHSDK